MRGRAFLKFCMCQPFQAYNTSSTPNYYNLFSTGCWFADTQSGVEHFWFAKIQDDGEAILKSRIHHEFGKFKKFCLTFGYCDAKLSKEKV